MMTVWLRVPLDELSNSLQQVNDNWREGPNNHRIEHIQDVGYHSVRDYVVVFQCSNAKDQLKRLSIEVTVEDDELKLHDTGYISSKRMRTYTMHTSIIILLSVSPQFTEDIQSTKYTEA